MNNQRKEKCFIVLVTLLFCFVVYYVFFLFSVQYWSIKDLRQASSDSILHPFSDIRQIHNLGWTHIHRPELPPTSYLNISTTKPAGIKRIGVFGGSDTEGLEVSKGFDFPSLLQKKFTESGKKDVEVINFGTGGYGLGQMLLLQKYLGSQYDLDAIVINLSFFYHFPRDLSFRLYDDPTHLRARYIISDDTLKLIEISSKDGKDAFSEYFTFIPSDRFRKYDIKPTGYLLPLNLKFNPWYYRGKINSMADLIPEGLALYKLMLAEFAKYNKPVIVICNDEHVYSLKEYFATTTNLSFYKSEFPSVMKKAVSFYATPSWHNSPLGNQLYADELFDQITNTEHQPNKLRVKFDTSSATSTISFTEIDSMKFVMNNSLIDYLYQTDKGPILYEDWNRRSDYTVEFPLAMVKKSSLLLLSENLNDISFVVPSQPLNEADSILLEINIDDRLYSFPIGHVVRQHEALFYTVLEKPTIVADRFTISFKENYNNLLEDFVLYLMSDFKKANAKLVIGKYKLDIDLINTKASIEHPDDSFSFEYSGVSYNLFALSKPSLLNSAVLKPAENKDALHLRLCKNHWTDLKNTSSRHLLQMVVYCPSKTDTLPFLEIGLDSVR